MPKAVFPHAVGPQITGILIFDDAIVNGTPALYYFGETNVVEIPPATFNHHPSCRDSHGLRN
jgi:hypothetical protein